VCLVAALSALASNAAHAVPAFPGVEQEPGNEAAQGFGSETPGGRYGQVLYVNTLDDHVDAQGCTPADCTLREAVGTPGARIVLFEVGGTIVLDPLRGPLVIDEPYITIAGQSAPGGGIEIRNDPDGTDGLRTFHTVDSFDSVVIATNDVVLRHLRIRPGPLTPNPECAIGAVPPALCAPGAVDNPPGAPNGATCAAANDIKAIDVTEDASNVVLDHLSLSWASYLITLMGSRNLTLQHSILSEGLNYVECDGSGAQPESFAGKALMTGNEYTATHGIVTGQISIHHNLFAHNSARNPQLTVNCPDPEDPLACAVDTVNNVTYNWLQSGGFGILSGNLNGHHFGNVVGNFIKPGPDGPSVSKGLMMSDYRTSGLEVDPDALLEVHHAGNLRFVSPGASPDLPPVSAHLPPYCGAWYPTGVLHLCPEPSVYEPGVRFETPEVTTSDADQAYVAVLAGAGASGRLEADGSLTFNRDANDQRVIATVLAGNGQLIDDFTEFPGFPAIAGGTPYTDTDSDGMADEWEEDQCLDPNVADSSGDPDGDVYTNIEEFLNGTDATPDPDEDGFPTGCDAACDDGSDNDGDGLVDLADPGCANNPAWPTENPACSNGADDDQDNKIDYPADNGCASATDTTEQNHCGMLGIEVVPVLLWAAFARRRRA
jgi:CSLREA domain-containing protein